MKDRLKEVFLFALEMLVHGVGLVVIIPTFPLWTIIYIVFGFNIFRYVGNLVQKTGLYGRS